MTLNQTTEATGRTLDDAKSAAAQALGMNVTELDCEVVEESAKGLFAKTNYRVRASVKAKEEPKPARSPRAKKADAPVAAPAAREGGEAAEVVEAVASKEDGKIAEGILNDVLKLTGLAVSAKIADFGGKYVNLQLTGKDVEVLVGEPPAIDALQYLTNAMFGRKHPNGTRLTLDAADHRSKRIAALEQLANDVATAVMERQQEAVLDPLPAHERRIIHNVLREFDGVETYSEGEEPGRHIVVSPKK